MKNLALIFVSLLLISCTSDTIITDIVKDQKVIIKNQNDEIKKLEKALPEDCKTESVKNQLDYLLRNNASLMSQATSIEKICKSEIQKEKDNTDKMKIYLIMTWVLMAVFIWLRNKIKLIF